jgi:phosphoserine phosphatase RsbU/P
MIETVDKKTLLIVDDDAENIQIVYNILGDKYEIRVAMDGLKALELAKVQPFPGLILLDVLMPLMDGYEVCRQLKADPRTRDIPVLFLTGKTEIADETRGFEVGAVDYIHKPFSPPIVTARVRTHLMLRDAHETVARQLLTVNSELELAREVQLSILPHEIPQLQGLEISARYLPMSSVAGDFYDFIVVDEKRIGILIADVSGHGLSAALIASMLQSALAAQSPRASDPAQVLSGLNQALYGKFQSHFVTAAYVFVDMEKNTADYAGGAHPPILHWRAGTREVIEYVENGLMLGPFSGSSYSAVTFALEEGDRIVLFTDGVVEAVDSLGNEFGMDRIKQILESKHALTTNRFADALLYGLSSWSEHAIGTGQSDDITVLTIDFKGHESSRDR